MTIIEVIGIKISYPIQIPGGAQKRTITIYGKNGIDCVVHLETPPDTPEFPVDVETPTATANATAEPKAEGVAKILITPGMIDSGSLVFREVRGLEFGTPESATAEIVMAVLGSLAELQW